MHNYASLLKSHHPAKPPSPAIPFRHAPRQAPPIHPECPLPPMPASCTPTIYPTLFPLPAENPSSPFQKPPQGPQQRRHESPKPPSLSPFTGALNEPHTGFFPPHGGTLSAPVTDTSFGNPDGRSVPERFLPRLRGRSCALTDAILSTGHPSGLPLRVAVPRPVSSRRTSVPVRYACP